MARLQAENPHYWPETLRGLMVHSAEWTPTMKKNISNRGKGDKDQYSALMRQYGYGVPSWDRAVASAKNRATMIVERQIQPFLSKEEKNPKYNEFDFLDLPFPKQFLRYHASEKIFLRITLSYFIEPNPGTKMGADQKRVGDVYRYASCGLRFELSEINQSKESFISKYTKLEDQKADLQDIKRDSSRWQLGYHNRNKGSLHSDLWERLCY